MEVMRIDFKMSTSYSIASFLFYIVANAPYPDTPSERRAVAKLRSLRRFQRHRGAEALLHHQLQEKRLQVRRFTIPIYDYQGMFFIISMCRSHKESITRLHPHQSVLLLIVE